MIFAFTLSGLRPIGGLRPGGTKGQNRNPFGRIKDIGGGIFEYKIDFGPGYRIYFGKDGEHIVIILGGGTKKRQQQNMNAAKAYWQDYKARKRKNE